jgi:hypothetical protein
MVFRNRELTELIALALGGLVGHRNSDLLAEVLVTLAEEAPVFVRERLGDCASSRSRRHLGKGTELRSQLAPVDPIRLSIGIERL